MKATSNINKNIKRTASTIMMLILFTVVSFGQGLLVEGAIKLIDRARTEKASGDEIILTNYSEQGQESRMENLKSFAADLLFDEASAEEAVEVESWMTTPYVSESFRSSNVDVSFEAEVTVESWMTTPFDAPTTALEGEIAIEGWMTTPFEEAVENQSIPLEDWMTRPFETETEKPVEVEDWMTAPFSNTAIDNNIEVETWMTQPFSV